MVMLAGLALATIFINIFVNPYSFINPFPPPTPVATLKVPTLTPSPRSLPEVWTATPETPESLFAKSATPSATVTQTGTRIILPSATATRTRTASPSPTKSITSTPNRTLTSAAPKTATRTKTSVAATNTPITPTSTQAPCSTTAGYCDDANSSIVYAGSWTYFTYVGPYNNTTHYSSTAGNTASFVFTGTRIVYVYPMFYDRGHARISIDGTPVAEISLYSPSLVWQQMWDSGTIASGSHTIVITVVDGIVDLDAFIVNYGGAAIITPPTVTTITTSGVTATGATLHGIANANGYSTTVTFQYGLTTGYGTTATAAESPLAAGGANIPVSAATGVLIPGSTYHYRVVGTNAGGTTYGSDLTFATPKANQAALVVVDPSPVIYGSTPTLSTTGGSGSGVVTFSAGSSTGCTVSGSTLNVTNASGTCSLTATKAADANYNAATSAAQSVTLQKANQAALVVDDPGTVVYGSTPTLTASGGSGIGTVTFSEGGSTGCSVSGSTLTVTNASGTCNIAATKAADNNYNIASSAALSITLAREDQTISFTGPGTGTVLGTYTPSATATSGLTVVFTIDPSTSSVCSISVGVVTYDTMGICIINADQAGNGNYNAAPTVPQSVNVS